MPAASSPDHPPALSLRLLRPVIELVIDLEQEHIDAAGGVLIVWQPFAVKLATICTLADDPAGKAGVFKRLPDSHLSRPESLNWLTLWNDPAP